MGDAYVGFDIGGDAGINIRMVEIFDKSPRTFQFHCSTKKIYPCCNYPIVVERQQSSNSIDISFKGIIESDLCLTALGPATAIIDLGALSDGIYNLNLYYGKVKRTGNLVVSSDSYKINFHDNSVFSFTHKELNRIPEHTIWGTVGYHKQETSSLVQSFITELMELGAEKKSYRGGHYGGFEIGKNGDIVQPGEESGYYFARSFIFRYSGDIAAVDQLVGQYARDYGTEYLYISVYTDEGEKFLSWMYQ
jgi:hypothetical protein